MSIRVMVVDDHPIWREGVARDLAERGLDVVATAPDAPAAVRIATAVRPDVILMDLNLGVTSGVDAIAAIGQQSPDSRVLVLSASGEHADVLEAVKAGALGYLVKSAGVDELLEAIRRTADGVAVFTPGLAGLVLGEYRRLADAPRPADGAPAVPALTDRETEVLRLVATGKNNREIAKDLFISENTVKNHVRNILEKLQLHSRMEAVMYAVKEKLLDLP